ASRKCLLVPLRKRRGSVSWFRSASVAEVSPGSAPQASRKCLLVPLRKRRGSVSWFRSASVAELAAVGGRPTWRPRQLALCPVKERPCASSAPVLGPAELRP